MPANAEVLQPWTQESTGGWKERHKNMKLVYYTCRKEVYSEEAHGVGREI